MVKLSSLSFLIPAYNDETTIEKVVKEAVVVGQRVAKKFEIVVVNDGSTDATVSLARSYLARLQGRTLRNAKGKLIVHVVNQGYGRTIKELYYVGRYDWLFTIPGDYQVGAKELEKLIPSSDSSDMILGWRVKRNDPANRLLSSWVYNTLLQLFFGVALHDVNSVRLMRRAMLKTITLTSHSAFVDAELVIRAKRLGYSVTEVPITHRARGDGQAGGGNQWRTMWGTVREMVKYYQYYQ